MKFFFYLLVITLSVCNIQPIAAQVIQIGETFSSDTVFQPVSGSQPVYSLHLYGSVQLYSDSSLVRVVLVDTYGSHFLIFETYPLITDTNTFAITSGCDETCFLNGIIPDSIRVDILSGFCVIDSIMLDTNFNPNATEQQAMAKWNNDSLKIAMMNHRINEEHMYWRAGRTILSLNSFYEKELKFGNKHMLFGYDYYLGGIFESPDLQIQVSSQSNLPDQFNWQDRHNANEESSSYYDGGDNGVPFEQRSGWLTKPKSQSPCQSCYAFSTVALVEANANLFFNNNTFNPDQEIKHHIDLDLSELKAMRCNQNPFPCSSPGYPQNILSYIRDHYISDEVCFPYSMAPTNPPCSDSCQNPLEFVKISSYDWLKWDCGEYVKEMLIKFGPISCFVNEYFTPMPGFTGNHVLLLVGYKVVKAGDTVYHGTGPNDPPIIIDSQCGFLGGIDWYFKDSSQDKFINHGLDTNKIDKYQSHYLTGDIYRYRSDTATTILCSDEDGDGYYWWGIHRDANGDQFDPELCNCPPGVRANQEDCNDNDSTAGPYVLDPNDPAGLYSCSPVDCQTKEDKLDIHEPDEQWTTEHGDQHIDKNIIIHTDAKLTINCQVFFTPGVKIIVRPGGVLQLEGTPDFPARLSSGCNELWGGIEVNGDPLSPQVEEYQGKVIIKYGTIENAVTGIKTINAGNPPDGGGVPLEGGTPSGGIVQATNAIFRNNITGVSFLPYRDQSSQTNKSYFRGCTFETTKGLLEGNFPDNLLKVTGMDELLLKGCIFRNARKETIQPGQRGYGIYSYNAELKLDTIVKIMTPFPDVIPCEFDSLHYGIYAMSSGFGSSSVNASRCVFKDNVRSMYASGFTQVNPLEIANSQFYYNNEMTSNPVYLLYLNNCTGFKVRQNSFAGTTSSAVHQYGVIVNNAGADNNYIYDNTFMRLTYGLQGFNINRNTEAQIEGGVPIFIPAGLRFICNRFEDVGCASDFLINANLQYPPEQLGIAYNQRNAANASLQTQEPAGNTFSQSHTNPNDELYDINISQSVGSIIYTHHASSYQNPNLRLKPDDVSNQDWVHYDPRPDVGNYEEALSCPDDFYPFSDRLELRSGLILANQKIDSLINLLQFLVDDGSTDTLRSTVQNSEPDQSYELYQELLSASPYLSDSVVKASIEKEEVLPNAMIRDIMVANPQSAKSVELLTVLDERTDPMPDSLWAEILQGMDTVSALERLTGELSGWLQRRDLCFNALASLFLNDYENGWAQDSLVSLYGYDSYLSSRYLLFQYYLNKFDFSSANTVLQNIPSVFDLTEKQAVTYLKISDLADLMPQFYLDTIGYIVPDSVQNDELYTLASTDFDLPGAWARNILIASGLLNYEEPIFNESELKSSRKGKYQRNSSRSINYGFKVFPNPAKDFIIVEYKRDVNDERRIIRILNINGRIINTVYLHRNENQQVIPVTGLGSGTYIIQFLVDGFIKGYQTIVILR